LEPELAVKIGLVQMNCEKGAIAENQAEIGRQVVEAAERGVDILAFPEMSLTGYADPNKFPHAVIRLDGPEVAALLAETRPYPVTILVGLIEANPAGKPFITHLVVREGELLGYYRKVTIEDEEVEWFSAGEGVPVFEDNGLTFGVAICADIENEAVFAACARQRARIVFEVAAPGLYGEQATRDWAAGFDWWSGECRNYLSRYARTYGLWIAVATQAGRTCDEDFPGGAFLFGPDGRELFGTPDWSAGVVYLELEIEVTTA
jgi:predicted amidohydrolase